MTMRMETNGLSAWSILKLPTLKTALTRLTSSPHSMPTEMARSPTMSLSSTLRPKKKLSKRSLHALGLAQPAHRRTDPALQHQPQCDARRGRGQRLPACATAIHRVSPSRSSWRTTPPTASCPFSTRRTTSMHPARLSQDADGAVYYNPIPANDRHVRLRLQPHLTGSTGSGRWCSWAR